MSLMHIQQKCLYYWQDGRELSIRSSCWTCWFMAQFFCCFLICWTSRNQSLCPADLKFIVLFPGDVVALNNYALNFNSALPLCPSIFLARIFTALYWNSLDCTACFHCKTVLLQYWHRGSFMDSSYKFQAPPHAAYFLWSCDKVYHKQEVWFLLYFLGQIVSWLYNPKLLD